MNERSRSIAIILCLAVTVLSSAVFIYATEGFYGTLAPSFWKALHPATLQQSDDVFLCSEMNGEGSDDEVFAVLLVFLLPLILFRIILFQTRPLLQTRPSWIEVGVFVILSLPFFLGVTTGATCADIALTLYVGKNLALGLCLIGWMGTAIFYLLRLKA